MVFRHARHLVVAMTVVMDIVIAHQHGVVHAARQVVEAETNGVLLTKMTIDSNLWLYCGLTVSWTLG